LIVNEFDVLPADIFLIVFLLFQLENVPHEELLQILVGVVDAKLFETIWSQTLDSVIPLLSSQFLPVDAKVFKSKDIQYSDGARVHFVGFADGTVQLSNNPDEQSPVNTFSKCISNIYSLHFG